MPAFVLRSKLFVPGVREDRFATAMASGADAVSFDLEDSVGAERKAEARAKVARAVEQTRSQPVGPLVVVRVNALDSSLFDDDVRAVVRPGLDLLNLPKVERVEDVQYVCAAMQRAESANGCSTPISLLLTIETPRGLLRAADLAAADPRVVGLQLGLADLFGPMGIARDDAANVHAAMFALRMAAGVAGVFVCDGAFADFGDAAGLRAEAQRARALGFIGKSCIHPSQIAVVHDVFNVSAAELAAAHRVLQASTAAASGDAFAVDGEMVDTPILARAKAIVDAAERGRRGSGAHEVA